MNNNIIDRLINVINLLNEIEIKGFYNIKNLGLAIQQIDSIVVLIRQNEQAIKTVKENNGSEI